MGEANWTEQLPVKLLLGLGTYAAVCFAWVFFRAPDFTVAGLCERDGRRAPAGRCDPRDP